MESGLSVVYMKMEQIYITFVFRAIITQKVTEGQFEVMNEEIETWKLWVRHLNN